MRNVGLCDSDTGQSLVAIKEVNVSDLQSWSDEAWLVYTEAKRGRIVQLQSGSVHIHYFYDEPASQRMIEEDGKAVVKSGSLAGRVGTVQWVTAKRVGLEARLFGAARVIAVDRDNVEAA